MCGIVGFLERSGRRRPEELWTTVRRMATTLRHRGPEDEGCWVDSNQGIALGHRRLSIIDLSPAGHQPMHSQCGRYILVFNGEIYNFKGLGRELEGLGQTFCGHSDTEVMLAAISRWGLVPALQKLNGMFAFAVWDAQERLLHLVRDRLGEKPLYYGWAGKTMLFASELKALRVHPSFAGEIDRNVLTLYMRHNYIPAPYSIYKGIYKLPPGTYMTLRSIDCSFELGTYWSVRQAAERGVSNPFSGSDLEAVVELESLLQDAVKLRMESDVPLGAFLSGGIDSSVVVALMQASSSRPVKSFTIGFHDANYDEASHAKAVAHHLGTEHTELYVTPEQTMAVIPRLPVLYDEPFADSSQIPTFLVSRLARNSVTVSLSGDGGDELFGGYKTYFRWQSIHRGIQWIPKILKPPVARALSSLGASDSTHLFGLLRSVLPDRLRQKDLPGTLGKLAQLIRTEEREVRYWLGVSHWIDPAAIVLGAHEPPTAFTDSSQWVELEEFVQVMMYLDTITYLPDDILVKVDRASMGVSLEARVPILDHRVVEFAWQLPLSTKLKGKRGKEPLRQILSKYVPKYLFDRPKKGFAVPLGGWLRSQLRPWAEALLGEARLQRESFFYVEQVRRKWAEHLSGRYDWQSQLWAILMFQAWLENQTTVVASQPKEAPRRQCSGSVESESAGAGPLRPALV
jgi:asparagine synthase (glutamine-hydrolysing)